MKQYICDKYTFYWGLSGELREKIKQDVGENALWVVCAAWNVLYSIYEDDTMNKQIAEVLYRPGKWDDDPDKYIFQ